MIVEDQENLQNWLLVVLEPLCDADPDALAKYIFALLKKDLSVPELKKRVCEQLEVFLSEKTEHFVDRLFTVLETKNYDTSVILQSTVENSVDAVACYMNNGRPATSASSSAIQLPECSKSVLSEQTFDCEVSSTSRDVTAVKSATSNYDVNNGNKSPVLCNLESSNKSKTFSKGTIVLPKTVTPEHESQSKELSESATAAKSKAVHSQPKPGSLHTSTYISESNKSLSPHSARRSPTSYSTFKYRTRSQSPFTRSRARSRPRRRSPSFDRNKRRAQTFNRSRKSPSFYNKNARTHSRSRSTTKRSYVTRSRSRSPFYNRKSYRNRSPQNSYRPRSRSWSSHSRSRSRSRSWSRSRPLRSRSRSRTRSRSRSPIRHLSRDTATPVQDSNHGDIDMRLNTTSQSIKSVVNVSKNKSVSSESITSDPSSVILASVPLPPISMTPAVKAENMASDVTTGLTSSHFNTGVKQRCRDFDEMGYCMRGDMCLFDHGVDPVVLEDIGIVPTEILNFGVAAPVTNSQPNSEVLPTAIKGLDIPGPMVPIKNSPTMSAVLPTEEYNPDAPEIGVLPWSSPFGASGKQGSQSLVGTATVYSQSQRELINVPVVGEAKPNLSVRGNVFNITSSQHSEDLPQTKRRFDFNRLGPPRYKNAGNCSLELKKVPPHLNNIFYLNNHFSKFGKIINIKVCYNQDPEAAVITFSTHAEANAAYRSTDAVLNNRFIKLFWHPFSDETSSFIDNSRTESEMGGNSSLTRVSVKDRLGAFPPIQTSLPMANLKTSDRENVPAVSVSPYFQSTYVPTSISRLKTEVSSSATTPSTSSVTSSARFLSNIPSSSKTSFPMKQSNISLLNKSVSNGAKELKMKNVMKISSDLRKRQQQLLEKLLEQQKSLVSKLENKEYTSPENKTEILTAIKKLQENIDKVGKELKAPFTKSQLQTSQSQLQSSANIKKAKQDIQREILDAELDLLMKQKDGVDITELKKKLENLKTQLGPWKL